ncbi:hypothetical protein J8J14_21590 [Roseomonas sp. SSH11]|uniref:Uncharacterized protein n=1 Tax=Pararoseomonas baculiformis TaxID=2820812 RepID=A0ABS4AKH6_9PROT|nr:hypothetical protein [Pararoseomonas baculiformis]MBP0447364.1 hypothetical protein [Pararoseomonas baculiformis]
MPTPDSSAEITAAPDPEAIAAFVGFAGPSHWQARLADIGRRAASPSLTGRSIGERHALELTLQRLSTPEALAQAGPAERQLLSYAREAVLLADSLPPASRDRLREQILSGLTGEANLIPLFHLLRVAARYRAAGFEVRFTGLAEGTAHDLLLARDGQEAEIVCDTVSAEEGRPVLRGDWCAFVDGINPDLQNWLASHPGRYVLKMTLPEGLKRDALDVATLQRRIMDMLRDRRRQDSAADAVLKLDPLLLAGAQAAVPAQALRALFGPEAHLAVAQGNGNILVLAARAGQASAIAQAVCRRMVDAAGRLGGERPGILAMFLDDLGRQEWRGLRERMELEGAVRRFLTTPEARRVAAVSCASRMEMFGMAPPDGVAEGELRFRNPSRPPAKDGALSPALCSIS